MNKTKRVTLALLSDTHGLHDTIQVPDADILVHAGDMTNRGSLDDLNRFASWLKELPHEHKIIVAGNHDWCFENNHAESKQIIEKTGAIYLQDEAVEVEGLNIYGSPWQPWFYDWAFNLPRDGDELKAKWAAIPNDTHILLTHSPPFGFGDQVSRGHEHVGCRHLRERIEIIKPALHVFGHIHEAYGSYSLEQSLLVNASICNLAYEPLNEVPVVTVEMSEEGVSVL